jgi:phosphoglycolate phosphatase
VTNRTDILWIDGKDLMESFRAGRVEAVIFDLDGTLIDSTPGIESSLSSAFQAVGRKMPGADFRKVIGPPIGIIAKRLEPSLTDDELLRIERVYRSGYDSEGWRESILFEGALATLQSLRQSRVRLFIATNKPVIPTINILAYFEITEMFEAILTRDSRTPAYASKSEMLSKLLEISSLQSDATVMVGDTVEDQRAASSNRMRFIFAQYGYGALASQETSIDCLSRLTRILL